MSNYKVHAMREFRAAGWLDENDKYTDDMQEMICNHVLALLDVFADEGHSGSSAPYAIDLFSKLAKFDPIVPLTGEDWEWNDVSNMSDLDSVWYQNNRCSAVFKSSDRFDGQPYYLDGKVFWGWYKDEDGEMSKSYFTTGDSSIPIEFPYTPKTEYVFRPTEQYPNDDLAKQVKQEPVAWMNDSGGCFLSDGNKYSENWTALYTAPPKPKPLTPQQISEGNQSMLNVTREAFKQGVIFAEKAHGIGGGNE